MVKDQEAAGSQLGLVESQFCCQGRGRRQAVKKNIYDETQLREDKKDFHLSFEQVTEK